MEFTHYLEVLRRGWWIVALTTLSALAIVLAASYYAVPIYEAEAQFILSPNSTLSGTQVVYGLDILGKGSTVSTYAEVLNSNRIFQEAGKAVSLDPATSARYSHSAVVLPSANVLRLSVRGPDPELAARLANSMGQRTIDYVQELYSAYDIHFLDPAGIPTLPVKPQPMRDGLVAAAIGFLLGVTLAILHEYLPGPANIRASSYIPASGRRAYSKAAFYAVLEEKLADSQGGTLALGFVRFAQVRDEMQQGPTYAPVEGHIVQEVYEILCAELRGKDIVTRWDENCFAVLFEGISGAQAARMLESVQQALSEPALGNGTSNVIRVEAGVAVATIRDEQLAAVLIARAMVALERAREKGVQTDVYPTELQAVTA